MCLPTSSQTYFSRRPVASRITAKIAIAPQGVRNSRPYREIKSSKETLLAERTERSDNICGITDMDRVVVKHVISQCNSPKRALSLMNNRMRLDMRWAWMRWRAWARLAGALFMSTFCKSNRAPRYPVARPRQGCVEITYAPFTGDSDKNRRARQRDILAIVHYLRVL